MCGRITLRSDRRQIADIFQAERLWESWKDPAVTDAEP